MIQPTVGRIVWYRPSAQDLKGSSEPPMTTWNGDPLTAQICAVQTERVVNLLVTDAIGRQYPRPYVTLIQEGDELPNEGAAYAEWMPYQQGKAGEAWKKNDETALKVPDTHSVTVRLRELINIQTQPGTIDQGDYHLGLANGMILAMSLLEGTEPKYLSMNEVTTFKQRVEIEKNELDAKIKKLEPFINSAKFEELPEAEQDRLMRQHGIMIQYSTVLGDRIAAFSV